MWYKKLIVTDGKIQEWCKHHFSSSPRQQIRERLGIGTLGPCLFATIPGLRILIGRLLILKLNNLNHIFIFYKIIYKII